MILRPDGGGEAGNTGCRRSWGNPALAGHVDVAACSSFGACEDRAMRTFRSATTHRPPSGC